MTAEGPVQGWTDPVAAFLRDNMQREHEANGALVWDHAFTSAYQMTCEALVALGEATEEPWGARPMTPPVRPPVLPRWDDVATVVVKLAHQVSKLHWRQPDCSLPPRRVGQWTIVSPSAPPPPAPNLAPQFGARPAHASDDLLAVLAALGLVADGTWTAAAEPVLWRCSGVEVRRTDPRFMTALDIAIATVPADSRAELSRLATITSSDVEAEIQRQLIAAREFRERYPKQPAWPEPTDASVRKGLAFVRAGTADWLFFRSWRLPDGWLTPTGGARALEIFHDPVAIAMRREVVARLFPGSDLARAEPPKAAG